MAVSVNIVPSRRPEAVELCVVAADRPGLLADITAALAANRMHVHAAQIHSRRAATNRPKNEGIQAVDLFWVSGPGRGHDSISRALPRLERDLRAVIAGQVSAGELARPSPSFPRAGPGVRPRITIDNRASAQYTVIEIVTRDRRGLLFALADAIYRQGLTIAVAKINTEGTRVTDVFYVSESDGSKVCLSQRAAALRRGLQVVVELEEQKDST